LYLYIILLLSNIFKKGISMATMIEVKMTEKEYVALQKTRIAQLAKEKENLKEKISAIDTEIKQIKEQIAKFKDKETK